MWIFVKLSSFLQVLEVFTLSNDKSDRKIQISNFLDKLSLRKKCPYSELFWPACFLSLSVFSPNAGKCGKNTDHNNSEYERVLRNVFISWFTTSSVRFSKADAGSVIFPKLDFSVETLILFWLKKKRLLTIQIKLSKRKAYS